VAVANGDTLEGGPGDDDLLAPNGVADTLIGGNSGEVSGDTGQWDAAFDTVSQMEDADPGPG
jgi:hypothetical protein